MSSITIETTLSKEAWFVAETQLDITEEKGNKGPEVKKYLKAVGLGEGYPWCMAFVYWCVGMAAKKLNLPNPLVKTAGVLDQYARTTLRKMPASSILSMQPGEIFIFIQDHGKGTGHTGFGMKGNSSVVKTIEGNSNDEGSREGKEVCSLERSITTFKGIIQLP